MYWDRPLTEPWLTKWKQFKKDLNVMSQLSVLRYYHIRESTPSALEIHGFSNASGKTYATFVYLRSVYSDGTVSTCCMASKPESHVLRGKQYPG